MEIKNILDEKIVDFELKATNKEEAIIELTDLLYHAEYITEKDEFIKDIYEREEEGMTGIGNYIAIPHGKSDAVNRIGIAIGRTKQDIEWETIDDQGVRLIFLFAVSNDHEYAKNHMMLLAQFAGRLGNDKAVSKLLESKSMDDLREVFD